MISVQRVSVKISQIITLKLLKVFVTLEMNCILLHWEFSISPDCHIILFISSYIQLHIYQP